MQVKVFLFAVISLLAITSCHKHDDEDTNTPVLTLTAPTENASFSGVQTVSITGNVTDESLHELTITITKDADGSTLFTPATDPEVHDLTSYVINETWTPSGITSETAVTLTVVAEDHNSNATTKTVKFKVKP